MTAGRDAQARGGRGGSAMLEKVGLRLKRPFPSSRIDDQAFPISEMGTCHLIEFAQVTYDHQAVVVGVLVERFQELLEVFEPVPVEARPCQELLNFAGDFERFGDRVPAHQGSDRGGCDDTHPSQPLVFQPSGGSLELSDSFLAELTVPLSAEVGSAMSNECNRLHVFPPGC